MASFGTHFPKPFAGPARAWHPALPGALAVPAIHHIGRFGLLVAAVGLVCAVAVASGSAPDVAASQPVLDPDPLETVATLERGGSQALALGSLNALERRLFADVSDGRLDEHSLLVAALVASGVDSPETLDDYQRRLDEFVAELKGSRPHPKRSRKEAEAVFDFLHTRILHGGYRTECTDLRVAMDDGRFNCVSASVLFQCLAEASGFDVCALEMPGHAMSRVHLPDGPLNVETTCAAWFRLMHDPKRQAQSVRKTLGTVPGGGKAAAREVSSVGLVAMVYYNRGVDLLAEGRYAEAAVANAKALHLDPGNQTARGNLLATLNNWAIALGQSKQLDEAIAMLRAGLAIDPQYEPFVLNYAHVQHQRTRQFAGDAGYDEGQPSELPAIPAP